MRVRPLNERAARHWRPRPEVRRDGSAPVSAPCPLPGPDCIAPGEQQGEPDRGQDISRDSEGVTLKSFLGLPLALVAVGLVVIVGSAGLLSCGGRRHRRSLALVDFTLLDQRHSTEELRN